MREFRSASQILFGFLPEQTADLGGRVWKVKRWRDPIRKHIDTTALRRELLRLVSPWDMNGTAGDYARYLRQNRDIAVYALDKSHGVDVEPFPNSWMCRTCKRVTFKKAPDKCVCGSVHVGQLPFVGYHDCGELRAPWVKSCPIHDELKVVLPGTTSAKDMRFQCPQCDRLIQKGLGFAKCKCGKPIVWNVHRAAPVYTPRSVVVVNQVSAETAKRLNEGGGPERALRWVVDGLVAQRYDDVGMTVDSLLADLTRSGLSESLAKKTVAAAIAAGEVKSGEAPIELPFSVRELALNEAVTIAAAMDQSRVRIADLLAALDGNDRTERSSLYHHYYPVALARSGLESIDLIEKFPVLTGNFGYTRGSSTPGASNLRPFRVGVNYAVYADLAETEALFVRLKASRVATWLRAEGFSIEDWGDERSARLAILRAIEIPAPGQEVDTPTSGSRVLTLVHSLAHRFIRRAAVFAGIDRNALAEMVVPHHLGFFIYAASRGDFVLGGLQAVFETELHHLVKEVSSGDQRCALDPGCMRAGGACMACLHLGEPSCRYYNRFLDRSTLFGKNGFLWSDREH
jgi:hypothetical protein